MNTLISAGLAQNYFCLSRKNITKAHLFPNLISCLTWMLLLVCLMCNLYIIVSLGDRNKQNSEYSCSFAGEIGALFLLLYIYIILKIGRLWTWYLAVSC